MIIDKYLINGMDVLYFFQVASIGSSTEDKADPASFIAPSTAHQTACS
jgi:hypothetical protein